MSEVSRYEPDPTGGGTWVFDEHVTEGFDDEFERSIPHYASMRAATTQAAVGLLQGALHAHRKLVLDLGCARGGAIAPIIDSVGVRAHYLGLEASEPMVAAATEQFAEWGGTVKIREQDLREGLGAVPPVTVALSILTLQFVPVEYRLRLLTEVYDHLVPRGGLVIVEKVTGGSLVLDDLMVDAHYGTKRENGYAEEEIERKRRALEGVLVPLSAQGNEDLLRRAGFTDVDVFWAWMNFRGWLAVKR